MPKPTIIDQLYKAVTAACDPIGIKKTEILTSPRGISMPGLGIVVTLKLSDDKDKGRVWSAVEHFSIIPLGSDDVRKGVRVLFEIQMGKEWQVARHLALTIAQRRVDAAIDAAIESATG